MALDESWSKLIDCRRSVYQSVLLSYCHWDPLTILPFEEWCLLGCYLVFLRSVRRLLVADCVVPSSPIFVTLMKEAPGSFETLVLTRATRRNNPEDTILHSHRRENLKSYNSSFSSMKFVFSPLRFLLL
jgi:hypothetical protein